MRNFRFRYAISLLFFLHFSVFAADKEPGGHGELKSGLFIESFKVNASPIVEITANYTINWKMWVLMGEPVGDYTISWKLINIKLMDKQRNIITTYSVFSLPSELKKASEKIELYIDGFADISTGGLHRFNTGVGVRAGGKSSFNVPGSPNWNNVFVHNGDPCDGKLSTLMDESNAKRIFKNGFYLLNLRICQSSAVSELSSLQDAIGDLCEKPGADKKYSFCPTQKRGITKPEANNSIEDAFANLEKQTGKTPVTHAGGIDSGFEKLDADLAEKERQRIIALKKDEQHNAAVQFCKNAMEMKNKCAEKACGEKPSETICVEYAYSDPCAGITGPGQQLCLNNSIVYYGNQTLRVPSCQRSGPNPKYSEWMQCTETQQVSCGAHGSNFTNFDACVLQRETLLPDEGLVPKLRGKLKSALECKPEDGKECPSHKNKSDPGGIRG